jgi:hypothetical protein
LQIPRHDVVSPAALSPTKGTTNGVSRDSTPASSTGVRWAEGPLGGGFSAGGVGVLVGPDSQRAHAGLGPVARHRQTPNQPPIRL